jgi:hypothetical protein
VAILDNGILSISPVSQHGTEDTAGDTAKFNKKPAGGNAGDSTDTAESEQPDESRSLWSRIVDGHSFVDGDSKLSPWLFASDPHGTQMANLICALDPYCELYVARVGEDTMGITAKRVEQVCYFFLRHSPLRRSEGGFRS